VGQLEGGGATRLFEFHPHLRGWLIGEVPGEVESAGSGASQDGRSAAVVVAVVHHEFGLSTDDTADQLAQPLTEQVGICDALPYPSTRDFNTPSEADVDRIVVDLDQWHGSEPIGRPLQKRPHLPHAGCLHLGMDSWETELERLRVLTASHLEAGGYRVLESVTKDGWLTQRIEVPGTGGVVRYEDDDRAEALMDLLRILDAYASPVTYEVTVSRRLLPDRRELRVSNGAVLRARGWSTGPPSS